MSKIESYTATEWRQSVQGIERDILRIVLEDGKQYTAKEVETLVKKFKAKEVADDGRRSLDNTK